MPCPTKKASETDADFLKRKRKLFLACKKRSKFANHAPSPVCRCKRKPRGLPKYTPKAPVNPRDKKFRPSPDGSPVPGADAGGRNRAAHYEYARNFDGSIQTLPDGSHPLDTSKVNAFFPVEKGTVLHDGAGNPRGVIVNQAPTGSPSDAEGKPAVKINYGQFKTIGSDRYVYAFSCEYEYATDVQAGDPPTPVMGEDRASGWIKINDIADFKDVVNKMIPVEGQPPDVTGLSHFKKCTIIGGNSRYGDLKVNPCRDLTNEAAKDYLERKEKHKRPGQPQPLGFVNLLYNLTVSTDTFQVGTDFYRLDAKRTPEPVKIPLYAPCSSIARDYMTFVYGFVEDATMTRRYGWIAKAALKC